MTQKEFKQRLVLRYLGIWLDDIKEALEVVEYNDDDSYGLSGDGKEVVNDAYDVAESITKELSRRDYNFFD